MSRLLSHIFRFIVIAFAYLLAITAACAFTLFLIWGGVTRGEPGLELPAGIAAGMTLPIVTVFAARYAFFPALALISGQRWATGAHGCSTRCPALRRGWRLWRYGPTTWRSPIQGRAS